MAESLHLNSDYVVGIEGPHNKSSNRTDRNKNSQTEKSNIGTYSSQVPDPFYVPETDSDSDGFSVQLLPRKSKRRSRKPKPASATVTSHHPLLSGRLSTSRDILSATPSSSGSASQKTGIGNILVSETPATSMGSRFGNMTSKPVAKSSNSSRVEPHGLFHSQNTSTMRNSSKNHSTNMDKSSKQNKTAAQLLMPWSDSSDLSEDEFEKMILGMDVPRPGSTNNEDVTSTNSSCVSSSQTKNNKCKKRKDMENDSKRRKNKFRKVSKPKSSSQESSPINHRNPPSSTTQSASHSITSAELSMNSAPTANGAPDLNAPSTSVQHLAYESPMPLIHRVGGFPKPVHISSPPPPTSRPTTQQQSSGVTPGAARQRAAFVIPSDSDDDIMVLADVSPTQQQLAADEALARRLQEEADRECAASIATRPSPIAQPNPHRPPRGRPHSSMSADDERSMLARIGRMSEYEWALHDAVYRGGTLPDQPAGETRELHDIIDQSVLDYMQQRRGRAINRPAPTLQETERNALVESLDRDVEMLSRIGQLSDFEWSLHQAAYLGRDVPDSPDGDREDGLDEQILNYLRSNRERRQRAPPARFARPRPPSARTRASGLSDEMSLILGMQPDLGTGRSGTRRRGRSTRQNNAFRQDDAMVLPAVWPGYGENYEQLLELLGDGSSVQGLTDQQLGLLPTRLYRPSDGDSSQPSSSERVVSTECNICFCDYEDDEKLKILTCFHEFHSGCIDKWLKTNATCPICRVKQEFGD